MVFFFFFFKQKTAYEIRNCDWSSDVCSSDLLYFTFSTTAAATRDWHFKKRGRCRNENRSIKEAGALPQREMGILKSEGAAATRDGHFKKRGLCRNEKWAFLKEGALPQ